MRLQKAVDSVGFPSDRQRNLGKVLLQKEKTFLIFNLGEETKIPLLRWLSSEMEKVLS